MARFLACTGSRQETTDNFVPQENIWSLTSVNYALNVSWNE